jgi:CheY-like chemotaxis protein
MADLGGLLQGLAAVLWVVLALVVFRAFRPAITSRISDLTKLGLTPAGVSMEFAETKLDEATATTSDDEQEAVGEATKQVVLTRVERNADLLSRARVLWVDDHPENNRSIVELLRHFGAAVDTPRSNPAALGLLAASRYDVVVSDVARDDEGPGSGLKGVELAEEVHRRFGQRTVLFTGRFDPTTLPGADDAERLRLVRVLRSATVGITNRFDLALHFILDELERTML